MNAMKKTKIIFTVLISIVLAGWIVWRGVAHASSHAHARKVLYYQDSMHPWIKSDQPGKCTICDMDLTPIYEGERGFGMADNMMALSSNNITVLNVQTEEVRHQDVRRILRVAGLLDANETKKSIISAPAAGRIEETAVDFAGVEVRKGQSLLTFYSPGLTQQKYRYMARAARSTEQRDPTGGLAVEKGDADPYYTDLVAPLSGTVIERSVSRGQYVSEGEKLFTIADASVLWFRFDVYEQQLPWLRPGQKVMVSLPSQPGEVFEAVISFIDPMLDPATRTVKVRADISNPVVERNGVRQRAFKFGMYAEGVVQADVPNVLAVSRSAVLHPGKSAHVYIDKGGGAYERRSLKLGQQGDELCEVRAGLEDGERVVTSGNVLLDAQAQFSQNRAADAGETDAMDLTPPTIVKLPGAATGMRNPEDKAETATAAQASRACAVGVKTQAMTLAHATIAATGTIARLPGSSARLRARTSKEPPTADPTARRMLEGPMFVRMAELRNAELAEARAAKLAGTNNVQPVVEDRP